MNRLACTLAVWLAVGPLAACTGQSASAADPALLQCRLLSAKLSFGRIHPQRPTPQVGEGEALVLCSNRSTAVQRAQITLAFPAIGRQTGLLQSGQGSLAVAFYRDAKFTERWGDDSGGAAVLHLPIELGPGETRQLRVPVHALVHYALDVSPGTYLADVAVTLTTQPR